MRPDDEAVVISISNMSDITSEEANHVNVAAVINHVNVAAVITVSGVSLAGILLLLITKSTLDGSWRYFLAGGLCACFSHAVATPIDVIKTRQQVDEGDFISHLDDDDGNDDSYHHPYGIGKTIRKLVKEEGAGILLAGLGPTTIGYFFEGALKFGIYEVSMAAAGGVQRQLQPIDCELHRR